MVVIVSNIFFHQSGEGRLHTYCPDYHHSMTVTPVNPAALEKQEQQDSHAAWKTPQGWSFPGKKTMIDSNVHPLKLHPARVDQLTEVSTQKHGLFTSGEGLKIYKNAKY